MMYGPLPRARLQALTDEDTLIWARLANRQTHLNAPDLFSYLLYLSFEVDEQDFQLLRVAQRHRGCWAHWATWRRHAVLLRGIPS
jgi:hypothetical protein